ncbi:MAG TPA: CBS domain-containing protein [Desulfotomaculum sp.]|nr:CBS domain-containing protein [Desulfotomaculum sp.]
MEIITTHLITDFDGLAAMVAAKRLYPGASLVMPGKASRGVEEFLALHKDVLSIEDAKNINLNEVRRLILVDTRNPRRIGLLRALLERPDVEVHIYDHHPPSEEDVRGTLEVVAPVGAAATLLIERIREAGIELSPFEATVLALGIYEDTGSLLYPGTTCRDVAAVEFLLSRGADLAIVADFLGRPLTKEQKELLKELIINAERHLIHGVKVLITSARLPDFLEGLALLTHKLSEVEQLDAVFSVVEMGDRVYMVGRSNTPGVDVRGTLVHFGGGGHQAAASASIRGAAVDQVVRKLVGILQRFILAPLTVAEIMTTPVKTVSPGTKIVEAGQVILRYGHSGLPVVRDGKLVGIISRRDLEKAQRNNLSHAPVKAFMSNRVVTVDPYLPVSEAQAMMIEHDIGRLPVVEGGQLIGIISRTDILKTLHRDFKPHFRHLYAPAQTQTGRRNIAAVLRTGLTPPVLMFLERAGVVARDSGGGVFLAGESVRDLLLGLQRREVTVVVEGDAGKAAAAVAADLGIRFKWNPRVQAATLFLGDGGIGKVVQARPEYFEYALGVQVEDTSLRQELYRRDFTVNALAVDLSPERFGQVVDYFGGRDDLQYGYIRVLHSRSFLEEPLRVLRAVQLAERFNFQIERQTLVLLREAVRDGILSRVSPEQLWREVRPCLDNEKASRFLGRCAELGIWPFIFPVASHWEVEAVLTYLPQAIKTVESWGITLAERWLCYFIAAVHWTNPPSAQGLCERYRFGRNTAAKVMAAVQDWQEVLARLTVREAVAASRLAHAVLLLPREAYPFLLVLLSEEGYQERFREVLMAITDSKPQVTGKDIKEMGYPPGPLYREVLDAVWQARLDGLVRSKEEELAFVREQLARRAGKESGAGA